LSGFDAKKVSPIDWGVIGGGALALIAMFMPWWGTQGGPINVSRNAWGAGIGAWLGALLVIGAAAVVLVRHLGKELPELPVGENLLVLGLAGLGTILILLRLLTLDAADLAVVEYGRKIGSWIGLLAGIVATAAAFLRFQASGEPLAFGTSGAATSAPPPPPSPPTAGYAPPAADIPPPAAPGYAPPAPPPAAGQVPPANPLETGGPPPPPPPAP
jgi:hypothetical protein